MNDRLGIDLKVQRILKHVSQEKMAEDTDMSRSFISHIESPNVDTGISLDTLFFLAQKYNFDIRKFFDGYENLMDNDKDAK